MTILHNSALFPGNCAVQCAPSVKYDTIFTSLTNWTDIEYLSGHPHYLGDLRQKLLARSKSLGMR